MVPPKFVVLYCCVVSDIPVRVQIDHNGAVTRPAAVKVRAQDRNGNWFELEAEGLLARCIQHENDHLDGITIMESSEYFYEDTEEGKKAAREAKGNN